MIRRLMQPLLFAGLGKPAHKLALPQFVLYRHMGGELPVCYNRAVLGNDLLKEFQLCTVKDSACRDSSCHVMFFIRRM